MSVTSNILSKRQRIVTMLSGSLGHERAAKTVEQAVVQLGMGSDLSKEDAVRVLETIAGQPGIVGITARFVKTRFQLQKD